MVGKRNKLKKTVLQNNHLKACVYPRDSGSAILAQCTVLWLKKLFPMLCWFGFKCFLLVALLKKLNQLILVKISQCRYRYPEKWPILPMQILSVYLYLLHRAMFLSSVLFSVLQRPWVQFIYLAGICARGGSQSTACMRGSVTNLLFILWPGCSAKAALWSEGSAPHRKPPELNNSCSLRIFYMNLVA